jgi:mRNA interferase RelE/StbE
MFEILIEEDANEFLLGLPPKSQEIIKKNLRKLEANPFPGYPGDKEKLDLHIDPPVYRMHIGRSYTAFYPIDTEHTLVTIDILTTIELAHKSYGKFGK